MAQRWVNAWYHSARWLMLLAPIEWLTRAIVAWRRHRFLQHRRHLWRAPVPVVIVGNITLGGTGKTPLVEALVAYLKSQGFTPGIISRGYGAKARHFPVSVTPDSDPLLCGDEPVLLAQSTQAPIVIDPDRPQAARFLLAHNPCDVIISDDGLQHYALERDIEIAVLDGTRLLGNRKLLPRGPLREPEKRLHDVDCIVFNGAPKSSFPYQGTVMHLQPDALISITHDESLPLDTAPERLGNTVHVVTGVGHPERIFATVRRLGFTVIAHSFADHHPFTPKDLHFNDPYPILMTSKDAVKCQHFADARCWTLTIKAQLPESFKKTLLQRIRACQHKQG